jgi:hypothetical protein
MMSIVLIFKTFHLYYLQSITVTHILCFCSNSWRAEFLAVCCRIYLKCIGGNDWLFFNIYYSCTYLEILTKNLRGAFQYFTVFVSWLLWRTDGKRNKYIKFYQSEETYLNSQWDPLYGEDLQLHHGGQVCTSVYVCECLCSLYCVFSYIPYCN